jgi:hypothetical protein
MGEPDPDITSIHHNKEVMESKIKDKKVKEGGMATGPDPSDVDQARTNYQQAVSKYDTSGEGEKESAKEEVKKAADNFDSAGKSYLDKKSDN